jgi:hypothetical protein
MTPADEATFCALWQQGLSQDAIAQRLGIPIGTVKSRAHTLAHTGKLTPRPRGGAYPRQKALARQEDPPAPARAPAPPPADAALPTRDPPAITFLAVPEVRELIHTVTDLVARVAALEAGTRDGTRTREPTRWHPHPWHHQAMDRPVVATPHRSRQGPGRDRGEGAEPSRGTAALDRPD